MKCWGLVVSMVLVIGCSGRTVRDASDAETITGAEWTAKDLKRVGEELAGSIGSSAFTQSEKYYTVKPRWMLARELVNETDEHINTRVLMEKVRTQLIKKSVARFVDDQALEDILREQQLQSSALFDNSKAAEVGKIVGAKMILRGRISNIRKRVDDLRIVYYNITMQVVDLETREILWTDEAEIQRLEQR